MKQALVAVFLGSCAYLGGMSAVWLTSPRGSNVFAQAPDATRPLDTPEAGRNLAGLRDAFEQTARKMAPSVVAIEAVKPAVKEGKSKSVDDSGSGVLVRFPGRPGVYAVTNNHVIGQAPPGQITINLSDNRILKPARVLTDPETDIALLAIPESESVVPAPMGDSDRMKVGNWVLAFGSPFGLNQTVTHGIISARDRGQVSLGTTIRIKEFLQTDAAINPGSSGGPLVNLDGEVIGLNTAIASPSGSNSGIAFSIPINLIKTIAAQLLDKGRITRGYLGVQLAPGFESAEAIRLGLRKAQGALVDGVHPETPAAQAGLRPKDVILEVNGTAVLNENQFINRISIMPPGQRISMKIWRDRKTMDVDALVGDWGAVESRFKR
ncbi:MAG: trypsin-like peptidase domain-containing protein [Gemmataceae bacterium]